MSIGGIRSGSLSTEAETTIELLRLATYKSRHYLYAMLVFRWFSFNYFIFLQALAYGIFILLAKIFGKLEYC
jgi:hypothetical protein